MKKLVTLVIWILAILVGGIYMTFPSSNIVKDATKVEKIQEDTERDNFMSAQEAKEYGLIDEVIEKK